MRQGDKGTVSPLRRVLCVCARSERAIFLFAMVNGRADEDRTTKHNGFVGDLFSTEEGNLSF